MSHLFSSISDDTSCLRPSHNNNDGTTIKKISNGSSSVTDPSSNHSHESGFQSAASLSSLDKNQTAGVGKHLDKCSTVLQGHRVNEARKYGNQPHFLDKLKKSQNFDAKLGDKRLSSATTNSIGSIDSTTELSFGALSTVDGSIISNELVNQKCVSNINSKSQLIYQNTRNVPQYHASSSIATDHEESLHRLSSQR